MSLPRYGEQCQPSFTSFFGDKTPAPTHVGCPGGSNTPGLIGGWTCPCECHTEPKRTLDTIAAGEGDVPPLHGVGVPHVSDLTDEEADDV